MGRKKTPVNDLFTVIEREDMKAKRAVCKYCITEVANNGSRKMEHVMKCIKIPDDVKNYKLNKMGIRNQINPRQSLQNHRRS